MASRGKLILDILKEGRKNQHKVKTPQMAVKSHQNQHQALNMNMQKMRFNPPEIECQVKHILIDETLDIECQEENTLFDEALVNECQAETTFIDESLEIECQVENNLLNDALSSQFLILQLDGSLLQVEDNRTETEDLHNILSDFTFSSNEILDTAQSLFNGNERPHSTVVQHDTTNEEFELFSLRGEAHNDNGMIENLLEINSEVVPKSILSQETNNMTDDTHDNEIIDNLVETNQDVLHQSIILQEINEHQQPGEANSNDANESDVRPMLNDSQRSRRKRHMVKEDDWEYKKAKLLREKENSTKGENNKKQRVCRSTFLATINIGEWTLLNWIKEKSNSDHTSVESNEDDIGNEENGVSSSRPKSRAIQTNGKSKREELTKRHNAMKEFFESLPQPTNTTRIDKEAFDEHINKKEEARKSKENDKENEEHVYTTDLQSLLLSPRSNASALYYRIKSIRPGVGVGQPKVTDIRCLLFTEDGKISYKLNYEDDYKLLPIFDPKNKKETTGNLSNMTTPVRPTRKKSSTKQSKPKEKSNFNSGVEELFFLLGKFDFPQLYSARLKIPRSKFNHLQELKMILPSDHAFYDNLPHD
ncbi:hypothetical protein J6590_054120 [Homalodisca vitripennis]|nr:hypothetical protein J6590_054120 [Homalodisca vitripennis]